MPEPSDPLVVKNGSNPCSSASLEKPGPVSVTMNSSHVSWTGRAVSVISPLVPQASRALRMRVRRLSLTNPGSSMWGPVTVVKVLSVRPGGRVDCAIVVTSPSSVSISVAAGRMARPAVMSAMELRSSPPRLVADRVPSIRSLAPWGRFSIRDSLDCRPRMMVSRFEKSCAMPDVICAASVRRRFCCRATRACVSSVMSMERM